MWRKWEQVWNEGICNDWFNLLPALLRKNERHSVFQHKVTPLVKTLSTTLDLTGGYWWGFGVFCCFSYSKGQLKQPHSFYIFYQIWAYKPADGIHLLVLHCASWDLLLSIAFWLLKDGRLHGLQPNECKGCLKFNWSGSGLVFLWLNCLCFPVWECRHGSMHFYTPFPHISRNYSFRFLKQNCQKHLNSAFKVSIRAVLLLYCKSLLWWKVADFPFNKRRQKTFIRMLLLQRIFQNFHFKVRFGKACSHSAESGGDELQKTKNQNSSSKLDQWFFKPRLWNSPQEVFGGFVLFSFLRIFNMSFQRQRRWFTYVRPF